VAAVAADDGVIRTLLVDDEPLAREGLRLRLRSEPDVEVVGEAADAATAAEAIAALQPDLLFLDVQMPGGDGFTALEAAAGRHLPLVVFCTAHDEHALRAFEVHALDYLLKPPSEARLREAVARARRALERERGGPRSRLAGWLEARASDQRLLVSRGRRWVALRTDEIDHVETAANYVRVHARGEEYLLRETLTALASRLDPQRFQRVHRRVVVQLDRISELRTLPGGDLEAQLRDGTRVRVGRAWREALRARLSG
jgi:two-component system LytT family response regulator